MLNDIICILILSMFIPLPAILIIKQQTSINCPSRIARTNRYLKYIYPIAIFVIAILLYFTIKGE